MQEPKLKAELEKAKEEIVAVKSSREKWSNVSLLSFVPVSATIDMLIFMFSFFSVTASGLFIRRKIPRSKTSGWS